MKQMFLMEVRILIRMVKKLVDMRKGVYSYILFISLLLMFLALVSMTVPLKLNKDEDKVEKENDSQYQVGIKATGYGITMENNGECYFSRKDEESIIFFDENKKIIGEIFLRGTYRVITNWIKNENYIYGVLTNSKYTKFKMVRLDILSGKQIMFEVPSKEFIVYKKQIYFYNTPGKICTMNLRGDIIDEIVLNSTETEGTMELICEDQIIFVRKLGIYAYSIQEKREKCLFNCKDKMKTIFLNTMKSRGDFLFFIGEDDNNSSYVYRMDISNPNIQKVSGKEVYDYTVTEKGLYYVDYSGTLYYKESNKEEIVFSHESKRGVNIEYSNKNLFVMKKGVSDGKIRSYKVS